MDTKPEQNRGQEEELEHGQWEVELLKAAPADKEQSHPFEPDLGEWPETTDDEDSTNDYSIQSQRDGNHLWREEERRKVLTRGWADAQDEEHWSESDYQARHHSFHELHLSASQHGALEHDVGLMPFANIQTPTPQSFNSRSGKSKQGSRLNNDQWMTPFALADGEMPGWFADDKWLGKRQRGSCGWQSEDDGDSADWSSEAKWFNEQWSDSSWVENDSWMVPFDELIQRTTPHAIVASDASTAPFMNSPLGPAVCIWNAGSSSSSDSEADGHSLEGNVAGEIFTDGQQVFQPVPSATGQPLFTDGRQLYASVCVVVGPPDEAVDPTSATACDATMCCPGTTNLSYGPLV